MLPDVGCHVAQEHLCQSNLGISFTDVRVGNELGIAETMLGVVGTFEPESKEITLHKRKIRM